MPTINIIPPTTPDDVYDAPLVGNYYTVFAYDINSNIDYIEKTEYNVASPKTWRKTFSYDGYGNITDITAWILQ